MIFYPFTRKGRNGVEKKPEVIPTPGYLAAISMFFGREERIRTSDPSVPNAVLYQAEPLPEPCIIAFAMPLHQKRLPIYHGLLYVSSPFRDLIQFSVTFEAKNA